MKENTTDLKKTLENVEKLIEDKKIALTKVSERALHDLLENYRELLKSPGGNDTDGYRSLYEIALALTGSLDPVAVVETALDEAIRHLKCERGLVVEVNKDGAMAIRVAKGVDDDEAADISSTMVATAVEEREGIIYDSSQDTGTESLISRQVTSGLTAPFEIEKDHYGVLYVDTRDPKVHLDETSLKFLERMAELAGAVLSAAIRINRELEEGVSGAFGKVIGSSKEMRSLCERARRISRINETILLLGESGTGKEVFARAIHAESKKSDGPFEAINCSAIPDELLESELFGYVEGAFTGAKKGGKPGIFELADQGTLFLDEIGDMPALLQAKLLRVLQERTIRRVGGTKDIPIDVRIIAATNQDLDKRMEEGSFREDLYYRLATFPLQIPPLRDRGNDILELTDFFFGKYAEEFGVRKPTISPKATYFFLEYGWRGNIRELENLIKRVLVDHAPNVVHPKHLPVEMLDAQAATIADFYTLEELEHKHVLQALNLVKGNRSKAAELLGISEATLYRWISDMKKKGRWPGDEKGE